ncbi:MAG: hypothetical protein K2P81_10525 [Bacteriovoracaceae bacterium]|nr:hypothetical protein [Bacteriovoracaceae bacterium]
MKIFIFFILISLPALAVDAFKIHMQERNVIVDSPNTVTSQYAVIIDNSSLSNIIGKFYAGNTDLKFVNVKAGQSKSVEFKNPGKEIVHFRPLAPAFQAIELVAGKKTYEIPPKQ